MLKRTLAFLLLYGAAQTALAQVTQNFTRVYGTGDRDLPTPAHTAKSATDATALQAVLDFVKAAGVKGWQGMTGEGMLTFAGDSTAYPAQLSVLGSSMYRLDITRDDGKQSIIHNGEQGVLIFPKGTRISVPPDASTLGLLAFPKLLSASYPGPSSVVTDLGTAAIDGNSLHRIALDDPNADLLATPWETEDLYFDTANKLVESAAYVHAVSGDRALYLLATAYDDYRPAGLDTLLPYKYTESLNGTVQWTLQLNSISLSTLPDLSQFQF